VKYYKKGTQLGLAGKSPDEMRQSIEAAYKAGDLPKRTAVSFAYMWSAEQYLGPLAGHFHPHLMIFAPYETNEMLGNNPFGGPFPQLSDDAGTPFAVVVVPVDGALAVGKARDHGSMDSQ